ncbi:hypothetical protein GCM10017559_43150 [Streptosporangium longisporum]|uniref:Uncharacterized protein n=1 Tax=Streptosporangium longisporum TaxID=46187 RepID=A0ABN3Y289_9ACTN
MPQIRLASDVNIFRSCRPLPGVGDVQSKALELAIARPCEAGVWPTR